MTQQIHHQARDLIAGALAQVGYGKVKEFYVTIRGHKQPTRVTFTWTDEDAMGFGEPHVPCCDLFVANCYPNERGEAFLNCWNWIGMNSKRGADAIAKALNAAGIPARATTHKKDAGVRFKFEPKW